MTDYSMYSLSGKERKDYYIKFCSLLAILGFLFYRNIIAAAACCAVSKPLEKFYCEMLAGKRRERLLEGFRDALYCISSSVAAGRSMPQALEDAEKEASVSYGPDSDICRELHGINYAYRSAHSDTAEMLTDFGKRSNMDEIRQFAASYRICRKSGGNLEDVCLKSCSLLLDKIGFRSETRSLIAQKKVDIMMLVSMPVIILALLNLISADYILPLYTTFEGRLIMTGCLAGIGGALIWSLKITDIKL